MNIPTLTCRCCMGYGKLKKSPLPNGDCPACLGRGYTHSIPRLQQFYESRALPAMKQLRDESELLEKQRKAKHA